MNGEDLVLSDGRTVRIEPAFKLTVFGDRESQVIYLDTHQARKVSGALFARAESVDPQ